MTPPASVVELVERFEQNREAYRRGHYNETQVRREFIDPFFELLGWDVANRQGYAEDYKDVIHEDSIKDGRGTGGGTKAPDYCFRVGGTRKFFVEAKKPSIDVRNDPHPAYQVRRYGWSARLPLSILTDFEEFAAYDCRIPPNKNDKPSAARVLYVTYKQYPERWDEIVGIFSREAIFRGSFDAYVQEKTGKRGTAEVDRVFLSEIEQWRDTLARTIALRNPTLSQRQLNFAVQVTIDRIIFLRICEARGIETYGTLQGLIASSQVYEQLMLRFRHADARYNSGLFHFDTEKGRIEAADTLTPGLVIDDKVFKDILRNLYYPDSPYEFSVLPADILGQVYEQFLGKVIRLVPYGKGQRAVVEEKPEVRKAGGVFYTPTFIVDTIVRQTLGKLLATLTLRQVAGLAPRLGHKAAPVRVADIACGSGSFLLGAYQYLLDWYLAAYLSDGAQKWATGRNTRLFQTARGEWRLTITERKRILLDHIYGVDIDPQAVEVTKLSLLLKVLEGESEQTLNPQLALLPDRVLPDLSNNIKCGNSLIGPDFYDGQQMALLDDEAALRVNVFDWQAEFPQVFVDGGFDVIIGNPPYIDSEWMTSYLPETRTYCVPRYQAASGNWDIFCVFAEKAIGLCRQHGLCGMIVPNKLGSAEYAAGARKVLARENRLVLIRDYSSIPVFPVAVYPIVYVVERASPQEDEFVRLERMELTDEGTIRLSKTRDLAYETYFSDSRRPWPIFSDTSEASPVEGIRARYPSLGSIAEVLGAATVSEAYEFKPLLQESASEGSQELRFVNSGTIDRYKMLWGERRCRYLGSTYLRPVVAAAMRHRLPPKRRKQAEQPKIIIAGMTKVLECALDLDGIVVAGKSTSIVRSAHNLMFLLGILNSRLVTFYYQVVFGGNKMSGGYLRIGPPQLKQLPIRVIDFTDPADVARHDRMVGLVTRMLDLHKRLAAEQTPHVTTVLQRQIEATDQQIDQLVYELYGLTDEEIKIVEEGASRT